MTRVNVRGLLVREVETKNNLLSNYEKGKVNQKYMNFQVVELTSMRNG